MKTSRIIRMLSMYQSLLRGEMLFKNSCTTDFSKTERTFDRDIRDIRLFLGEKNHSNLELAYDKAKNGYYLKNLKLQKELGNGEVYFLAKLISENTFLQQTEQEKLQSWVLSQLEPSDREEVAKILKRSQNNARKDGCQIEWERIRGLISAIENKQVIDIQFYGQNHIIPCYPYSLEALAQQPYLVGWEFNSGQAKLYKLAEIARISFNKPLNLTPFILGLSEQKELQKLVTLVQTGESESYAKYLYTEKKDGQQEDTSERESQ